VRSSPDKLVAFQPLDSIALSQDRAFAFSGSNTAYTILEIPSVQDITRLVGYLPEIATVQIYSYKDNGASRHFLAPSLPVTWHKPAYNPLTVLSIKRTAEEDLSKFVEPFKQATEELSRYSSKLKIPVSNILKSRCEERLFSMFGGSNCVDGVIKLSSNAKCAQGFFVIGDLYGAVLTTTGFTNLDNIPAQQPGAIYITNIRHVAGIEKREVIENSVGLRSFRVKLDEEANTAIVKASVYAWNHAIVVLGHSSREVQARIQAVYDSYITRNVSLIRMQHLEKQVLSAIMPGNGKTFPYPLYLDAQTAIMATGAFMRAA
jgi:hypothetical protein